MTSPHSVFTRGCGPTSPAPATVEMLRNLPPDPLILLMGDLHGKWPAATAAYRQAVREAERVPDLLIQLGDWGYYAQSKAGPMWELTPQPLSSGPDPEWEHPVLFLDGNHEDHSLLWHECAARIGWPPQVHYAPRGLIWSGVLFMGGAYSVNKQIMLSTPGGSSYWSPLEEITPSQTDRVLGLTVEARNVRTPGSGVPDPENLRDAWQEVHTVFSHTAPSSFDLSRHAKEEWGGENKGEISRRELDRLWRAFRPKSWAFGHWHGSGVGVCGPTRWRLLDQIPSGPYPDYAWVTLSALRGGTAFRSL